MKLKRKPLNLFTLKARGREGGKGFALGVYLVKRRDGGREGRKGFPLGEIKIF